MEKSKEFNGGLVWSDGDQLEEFNKLLERILSGEFDEQIKEFDEKN